MSIITAPRKSSKSSKSSRPELTVSLCLAINHQVYDLTPNRSNDPDVLVAWRLEKKGADGAVYDVAATVRGHECSCPDFVVRREGLDASGCKHIKAAVRMGLLPVPLAPVACCDPSEPAPCAACIAAPELSPQLTWDALFPAPVDPWDVEGDPSTWPADTDEAAWVADEPAEAPDDEPCPDGWDDHLSNQFEPSEDDRREVAEAFGAMNAREHLDASERLTLAELTERQIVFYESWGNATGAMFASALTRLLAQIRLTSANSPAELEARVGSLEDDAHAAWVDAGYREGREAAGINCMA